MTTPKVSVIVPAYNHRKYLNQRLDSILAQTFGDFELIVLDDASTDGSDRVLAQYYSRPRTRIVVNTQNSGCAFAQWNLGLELAHGQYVWIAESDDFADPAFLQTLVPVLDAHSSVGLAYCQSMMIDQDSREIGSAVNWTADLDVQRWHRDFVAPGRDEVRKFLLQKNTVPNASAVLCRRSALMAAFPVDATFRLCGDWLQWAKVLMRSDVAFVARALNFWRIDSSNSRPLPPGLLEWQEGERVIDWVCRALGFDARQRDEALLAFARRCLGWATGASRKTA
jgi:glycosyltransferase involved in cell wall biosynthesis